MISREAWVAGGEVVRLSLRGVQRRIFVRSSGNGERAMLFLHGFPTSSWDWAKVEPSLARRYRAIVFDFLGFGASEKPRAHRYDLCEQADLAEAVARHFGTLQLRVVAHDYGSSVAQELLARRGEGRLDFEMLDLTLLNGGLYPDLHRPVRMQRILRSPLGSLASLAVDERRMSAALSAVFSPQHRPSEGELTQHWAGIAANAGHRIGHRLIRYIDDRLAHERRWVGALENTNVPLRFVWGMQDPVSGAHVMERLRERFGERAQLFPIPEAGHYPQLETPERVVEAIDRP